MKSDTTDPASLLVRRDAYAALRIGEFRRFLAGHLLSVLGVQMQNTAVGWQLYQKTSSAWSLAYVGVVQVVPMVGFALIAGQAADRFDRRKLLMAATLLAIVSAVGLAAVTITGGSVFWIYACLFLSGTARAFQGPARSSLMPQLVPRDVFTNSVTWAISGFELSSMIGPALGGLLVSVFSGGFLVYGLAALGSVFYIAMLASLPSRAYIAERTSASKSTGGVEDVITGFKFVRDTKVLLAAISLDMFAVLFGGAVALLPIYAKDILHVGATGFGLLRAAPSIGAITMAMVVNHLPPMKHAGRTLLLAVAGFGLAIIVFGLSRNFWLSLIMLFLTGAFDNISVVIRHTLATILTPDEMRGRVSAINGMFISASNELGSFESGSVAALASPVFSVVGGGVVTLLVVLTIAKLSPQLRGYASLDGGHEKG